MKKVLFFIILSILFSLIFNIFSVSAEVIFNPINEKGNQAQTRTTNVEVIVSDEDCETDLDCTQELCQCAEEVEECECPVKRCINNKCVVDKYDNKKQVLENEEQENQNNEQNQEQVKEKKKYKLGKGYFETNLEISDFPVKAKLSNGKNAHIKIMPETANEKALERLRLNVCSEKNNCTIELKEVGQGNETRAAYEVQLERHYKLLGLFKLKAENKVQVDAETGEIILTKKPWWSFLAIKQDIETPEENKTEEVVFE